MAGSKFNLKDVGEGLVGAFLIAAALITPFLRSLARQVGRDR